MSYIFAAVVMKLLSHIVVKLDVFLVNLEMHVDINTSYSGAIPYCDV